MLKFIAFLIIGLSCSIITIRTLVSYIDLKKRYKLIISFLVVISWFAPIIMNFLKTTDVLPLYIYTAVNNVLYTMLGFVFILFITLFFRDIVWYIIYGIAKLIKINGWHIDPKNIALLNKANIMVATFALIVSAFAFWQGTKTPKIKDIYIYTDKIEQNFRIAQISDLHITRASSESRIRDIVNEVNMLNPDIIVLTGDTIDDKVNLIRDKLNILKELSAPFGVYSVMGKQEFYNDVYASKKILDELGLTFLYNGGLQIDKFNVFIAGIPDINTMYERINFWKTLKNSKRDNFKVLLSHSPIIINSLSEGVFDLVLSGHTHGGQIFPIHYLVKKADKYLSGFYKVNGTNLMVSNGAGTVGPSMRLFAPSDIIIINLLKK